MTFQVTFVDGSAEVVNAGSPGQARIDALRLFPDRIVAAVRPAGLSDLMVRRRPPKFLKTEPRDPA